MEALTKVERFLSLNDGYGYGSGYGSGDGSGYGYGYGDGSGYGSGYGSGSGSGSGDGYGIKSINDKTIYHIDGVPTVIGHVHGNIAKGHILQGDLTLTPCYIAKGNNMFAHGDTLQEAMEALQAKMFEDMPEEERIEAFVNAFEQGKEYPNSTFFDWHNRLTGSCEAGRKAFARDHDIDLGGSMTVEQFLGLTKNAYEGRIIRAVIERYQKAEQEAST